MMIEEKAQAEEEKEAEKHVGKFKKALTKLVKEPAAVEKISAKMTPQKMADLKRKMKSGELDEEKLARVMLQHSLKEGWVKKK
jgi:anti-sigma28 factor (negative regulator of flagellin synthesis)